MRTKKVRGHNRIQRQIAYWRQRNLKFDIEYLKEYENDYVKIWIHPWSSLNLKSSIVLEPKGKTKRMILTTLLDIYDNWKIELDKLNQPYYLRIWFFEPRFSHSQVVCAVGKKLENYNNTFTKSDLTLKLNTREFGDLSDRMKNYSWDSYLDEDHFDNDDLGTPDIFESKKEYEDYKKWFETLLKKPHRVTKLNSSIFGATESYSFKKGLVWLGYK